MISGILRMTKTVTKRPTGLRVARRNMSAVAGLKTSPNIIVLTSMVFIQADSSQPPGNYSTFAQGRILELSLNRD
jgi:hypothetical protein